MTKLVKHNQINTSGIVHYRVENRDDSGLVTMFIDYERAPEPDHSYIADYFEVHKAAEDVVLVFGKTDFPASSSLRNKIEIYFPNHAFMHQLWKSTRNIHDSLRKKFQEKGRSAQPPGRNSGNVLKVQTLASNNVFMVNSGGQCVMDFFVIPAKDIWLKTKKNEALNISAVVRVYINEYILLGMLNRCDEIAEEIKPELDVPVEEVKGETVESI